MGVAGFDPVLEVRCTPAAPPRRSRRGSSAVEPRDAGGGPRHGDRFVDELLVVGRVAQPHGLVVASAVHLGGDGQPLAAGDRRVARA